MNEAPTGIADARRWLTAAEAAAELGVTRATLYAYVSRGLIRSEATGGVRARRYDADDVRRVRGRRSPERETSGGPLDRGGPVLDSAITLIDGGRLYYRGRDAIRLAETASLETVAGLLWQTGAVDAFAEPPPPAPQVPPGLAGMSAAIGALAAAEEADPRAYNADPLGVARTGARLARLLAAAWLGLAPAAAPLHRQVAGAWSVGEPRGVELLRAALVLHADHELNASAFAARVVAATRASPYAAAVAGLAALSGPRHGGATRRVAAFFRECLDQPSAVRAVAERLRRGEAIPGFGHPLDPGADPRAAALLAWTARDYGRRDAWRRVAEVIAAARDATGLEPTIDVTSTALTAALGLPAGAPIALFAIARSVGWVAHVQEQYAVPALIRPRSRYVGEVP